MLRTSLISTLLYIATASLAFASQNGSSEQWQTTFEDQFDSFDDNNWQDQLLWVNNE